MYLPNTIPIILFGLSAAVSAQNAGAKGAGWYGQIDGCKKIGSNDQDQNRQNCMAGICLNLPLLDRDNCWDTANAPCDKRTSLVNRDKCYLARGQCKEAGALRRDECYLAKGQCKEIGALRRDECYRKFPDQRPTVAPLPPRQSQPVQSLSPRPPLQQPAASFQPLPPRPQQTSAPPLTSWGPANNNQPGGFQPLPPRGGGAAAPASQPPRAPAPVPQPARKPCNNDQECFDKGLCDNITSNSKHDECFYKKKNKQCDGMREALSKDFCYACTKQCNRITGQSNDSKTYKQGCERGQMASAC